jgi:predicted thioesterase
MGIITATLNSHNHIAGDIERGIKLYEAHKDEITHTRCDKTGEHSALIPLRNGTMRKVTVKLARDGCDVDYHRCYCTRRYKNPPLCRHSVAAILAIQGGESDSLLKLGVTAAATVTVNQTNTAVAVGSGSLEVYSTPAMIALMEKAACECLADGLAPGQTTVGTEISVEHIAASKYDSVITAEAKIEKIFGRRIELSVAAYDGDKKIGMGNHTRFIVDSEKFMARLQ